LFLLRVLVGASAIVNGFADLAGGAPISFLSWPAGMITMLAGASLHAGFLTTVFAAVIAVDVTAVTFSGLQSSSSHGLAGLPSAIALLVLAIVVALLGPGAYSVDARLFGMREIVITRSGPPEE
jgi:uncharacterized membrane protein YphA (DoxX/SURF4 family)